MKIPIKSGLWDLFIYISCHQNDVSQKNPMGESGENPQNLFSSISPKKNNKSSIIRIYQHSLNVHYTGLIHAIKMVRISIESPWKQA